MDNMEYIQIVAEFDLNANQPTMDNLEYIHIVAEFDLNESTGDDIKGNWNQNLPSISDAEDDEFTLEVKQPSIIYLNVASNAHRAPSLVHLTLLNCSNDDDDDLVIPVIVGKTTGHDWQLDCLRDDWAYRMDASWRLGGGGGCCWVGG